jgi:predicted TIM-barrel fold metal-dependent hydrolase
MLAAHNTDRARAPQGAAIRLPKPRPPSYPEATRIAQAFVKAAPERLVWGSDWPHPSEQNGTLPDDAILFDLLAVWAPDETTRKRILVDNPENLYAFAKTG